VRIRRGNDGESWNCELLPDEGGIIIVIIVIITTTVVWPYDALLLERASERAGSIEKKASMGWFLAGGGFPFSWNTRYLEEAVEGTSLCRLCAVWGAAWTVEIN